MKKNTKMLSLAAAALLAVAPVAASAVPVSAATNTDTGLGSVTTNNSNTPTANTPFFSYKNGAAVYNGGTLNQIDATGFKTIGDIVKAINDNITFSESGINGVNRKEDITGEEVIKQLNNDLKLNIKPDTKNVNNTKLPSLPANFSIGLQHTLNGVAYKATVPFYITSTATSVVKDAPQINVSENGGASKRVESSAYYQIAAGSNFDPISFVTSSGERVQFSAQQTSNNSVAATLTASSNPVNTAEQGRFYRVTLTASNMAGKTSTYSYTVLIVSNGLQKLYANGANSIQAYGIYGNTVSPSSTTFKDGQEVYVGNTTRTIDKVSYSKVSTKSKADADSTSNNLWVKTSSLTSTAPTVEKGETHTIMVNSKAYSKDGKYLGHMYYAYDNIDIVPKVETINGKTYYKVANKDEYVRVTNITGTQRKLRHNAYIYWSSYRRTPGTGKMYKGQTVTTYGASYRFKNGKRYYRIEGCRNNNKRYIKAVNFY